ncbi:hypothetical protein [Streptomyces spectabilis]|uniref:Uncharacterized protein n=1 Tax=Streptomyces spectabilis TaxID=68270 RepID=A0A516R6L4_STRST|nr:hypothetical protein [Streptomyces spectabilis]QDQ11306.1 hypothetical protein FH965_12530 [Streptomyces spectabilis]
MTERRPPGAGFESWIDRRIREKIREALRTPPPGPPLGLRPYGVDEVAREWRARHPGRPVPGGLTPR